MKKMVLLILLFGSSLSGYSQADTLIKKLDSLSRKTSPTGETTNNTDVKAYDEFTQLNPWSFFVLQASNLKQAFTKPFHLKANDWKILGGFALLTGALTFADKPIQEFALDARDHNKGLRNISLQITNFGGPYEGYVLEALGAYGLIFNNKKMKTTTLLAVQSYITGAAVESVLKAVTSRQRPNAKSRTSAVAAPTFHGPFNMPRDAEGNKLSPSFPSGHTTVAFAAATVYALQYANKPWVPILCYTSATLIGLSRITENKHWTTDVLVGAALGYLTGRQVVNNYHRYARLKVPQKLKDAIHFSLGYQYGRLSPMVVYRF